MSVSKNFSQAHMFGETSVPQNFSLQPRQEATAVPTNRVHDQKRDMYVLST